MNQPTAAHTTPRPTYLRVIVRLLNLLLVVAVIDTYEKRVARRELDVLEELDSLSAIKVADRRAEPEDRGGLAGLGSGGLILGRR